MQKSIAVGISLPKDLLSKIDVERRDISRSRYLQRLVEKAHATRVLGDKEVTIG
jgi:metal-responsive CopG/Arc/MetJ family transcriptional regulator